VDLTAYQNETYARRYVDDVNMFRNALKSNGLDEFTLVEAVARSLYKLMAYKDEYEVARAYTDGHYLNKLQAQFDGNYKIKYHFAPPLFASKDPITGQPIKKEYGSFMWWALKLLAPLKVLRGSLFDPFGYLPERREERRLISEYQTLLYEIIGNLTLENYGLAVELASSPMKIRGFGHVKDHAIKEFKVGQYKLLKKFRAHQLSKRAAE
jgi:indolepyruvate ferredoxin oxidoreductase